ncbi:MAG: hypothetical protein HY812_08190 [Planctomycetes bacterium]|nr:hypothetical protein [Planctomycetota bacterium]
MASLAIPRSQLSSLGLITLSILFATSCSLWPQPAEEATDDSQDMTLSAASEPVPEAVAGAAEEPVVIELEGETVASSAEPAPAEPQEDAFAEAEQEDEAEAAEAPPAEDDQVERIAAEAEERWRIKQQQLQMEAEETYKEGERRLEAGDYEGAAMHFEQALNHIRWAPIGVEWGSLEERASSGLEGARRAMARKDTEVRRHQDREAYEKIRGEEAENRLREEQVTLRIIEDAIAAYERNDFVEAQKLCDEVLKRDPKNDRGRRLKAAAVAADRDSFNKHAIDTRKEEFRRWKQEIEETRIPYADILTGPDPDFWRDISDKRTREQLLALSAVDTPEVRELKGKLQNTRITSIQFPEVAVAEAANHISILSGIPIVIDPEVAAELDSSGVVLNISTLTDISVESLLNIVTAQAGEGLTFTVQHGVVLITKKEKALGAAVPRIHTVQDLTFALTDFKGPKIGSIPLPGAEFDEEEGGPFGADQVGENVISPEEIINLIRENIARDTWDTGNFSLDTANNNQILVIHTPQVQLQVAQFLDDLRRFASSVITIESRFAGITEAFLQEIGVDWRGLNGATVGTEAFLDDVTYGLEDNAGTALDNNGPGLSTGSGLSPVAGAFFNDGSDGDIRAFTQNLFESSLGNVLTSTGGLALQIAFFNSDDEYNAVVRAVEKSLNATEITAPILTVYNTERAYVTVTEQISFVQDFDVDVANSAFIANPNIGIIQEGVVLDVRPTVSYDRKYITLEIQATVANLIRPIREYTTSLAGFSIPVTFMLPELEVQTANTTVRVPDGGSLVLGGLKRLRYVNRTAEVPWLGKIPLAGALFRYKGLNDEVENVIIIVKASITNLQPWRGRAPVG